MKKSLQISKSIELGPRDVALVWDDSGVLNAHVSDEDMAQSVPQHVLLAMALMMSMDDPEMIGLMWDKFEKTMDDDIVKHS
ncbi:MAG: hypothetical protein HOL37_04990 [Rhodospirillaceae bacterium]|nr:hypothetical protein [Rhodospirillaceae bacterium]MBT5014497.1 hypothetical protein [Rhodospirillaceae bacterium]MBT5308673.1 hypothetical protein [Rhodospirillaceae bacterium]MBT7357143.1 hypothetical protein [Rhodospirillaceae bacterium]